MNLNVFDTDILTMFEEGHSVVLRNVSAFPPEAICTTIVSVQEQLDGWNDRLPRAKTRAKLAAIYQRFTQTIQFLSRMRILTFTEPAIERFDHLKRLRLNIGKMDLRIAAIVLEENGTLISRNLRDFSRIPGLRVEDWTK